MTTPAGSESPRAEVRYYSERDYPLGPPPDSGYAMWPECRARGRPCHDHCSCETVPVQLPHDSRMWMSVEWAAEHGIAVPENWRDYV